MSKADFLVQLRKALSGLPQDEVEERVEFYNEMIEDSIEEGVSEEQAVRNIGTVDEIACQIISDIPLVKIAKERIKPKRGLKVWEIVLLALGSPIWLSLLISVIAVIVSLYVSLWFVIVSLWAVFASLAVSSVAAVLAGVVFVINVSASSGVAVIAVGAVCTGLSIFMFYGCKLATKGILILTKKFAMWLKNCIVRKGKA